MSENTLAYGYEDDDQEVGGGLSFGLNAGVAYLTKFEYNPNGGADGSEQDALDIVFNVNGKDISYRMFPVTKAFADKTNEEVTDPRHPAMKKAMREFNSVVVHILHAFVPKESIKTALATPITSFKQFCDVCAKILPQGYDKIPLDLFAQWQWQITGDNDRTYLRLPKNMKHGKWVCKHIPPKGGQWETVRLNGALSYKDSENNKHPFQRTKWFMNSNFAEQQVDEELSEIEVPDTAHAGTEAEPRVDENPEGGGENWQ